MNGLSLVIINAISRLIGKQFDQTTMGLLGIIPQYNPRYKRIILTSNQNSLTTLYAKALGSKTINQSEEEVLKTSLRIAHGYMEALKERTIATTLMSANAYAQERKLQKEPVRPSQIKKIIEESVLKSQSHLKMIVNSESNKVINTGMALQIAKIGDALGDEDPTVFFHVTIDDVTGPEEFILHLLPDRKTPRLWKMSEIATHYHKKGDPTPSYSGLHPNCFVGNSGVVVLTEHAGYINIKDVKIGDRVLTHTGQFKRVLNTLEWYGKKYYGKYITIKYKGKQKGKKTRQTQTLKVTPEHLMMTQRGWVRADSLSPDDRLMQLKTKCAHCNSTIDFKPIKKNRKQHSEMFCNKSCSALYLWSHEGHREIVSQKNKEYMLEFLKENPNFCDDRILKAQEKTRQLIQKKKFWAQKPEYLDTLQINISKINQRLQLAKSSKEEDRMYDIIKSIFPSVQRQVLLQKWCVDFFIPELSVNIEYDGGGHYLPVYTKKFTMDTFLKKQKGRDDYLNKCDIHVLRYGEIPDVEVLKNDILRASANYTHQYFFEEQEIESIEVKRNSGRRLYDLTVEDDESFVVNGVISHNCRCKISYLPKGYGFTPEGKITFISLNHDDFKEQRAQYGLPRPLNKEEKELDA